MARLSVRCAVAERLLRDAKQRQRRRAVGGLDLVFGNQRDLHLMPSLDFGAVALQRREQSDVVQHTGVEAVREPTKRFSNGGGPLLDRLQNLLRLARLHLAKLLPEVAGVDGYGRDLLTDTVM